MLPAMRDWRSWVVGGAVIGSAAALSVRARQAGDVGPGSTPERLAAEVERDLEMARIAGRPRT
jgi:hypothetical protein